MLSADEPVAGPALPHMPVNVRNASLALIAALLCVFALHWASAVFIPVMMGLMFSYALTPAVDFMSRWRLPRPAGAALLLIVILSAFGWGAYALRDDADSLIESLPEAARRVKESVRSPRNQPDSNFDKMQKAATQLEQAAADGDAARSSAPRGVARVQIEKPAFNIKDYVVVGGLRLAEMLAQSIVVCVLTYFLLASGDTFRRKLVRIAGPTFARRKVTVQALNEIGGQIQRYLVVQLLTSAGVGLATAAAFWMIGMKHAAVWGVAAAVLNLMPYIGSIALCGLSAVVALTQFGTLEKALLVASISVGLHIVSGYLVAPWLTGRTSRLSAVVVFVGVLAWGWLWGVWGLLLGAPILMAIKAVCDRVDDLKPIGELLGGSEAAKIANAGCDSEQTSDPAASNMQA
ncbi:MAG TPA: AI-2E family transporter [Albitalea sp.]|nr:AI-2E family transporter [Albitalea sp.]